MSILIYGVTGFTGRLCLAEAVRRGVDVVAAGRDAAATAELASVHGVDGVAFELTDENALRAAVSRVDAVLHIAGPFVHTAAPMRRACLEEGAHYLDITGEIDVLAEHVAAGPAFAAKGLSLVSAVGFDTVPTDCLLAYVSERVGGARSLELGVKALAQMTRGTAKSGVEGAGRKLRQRRGGALVELAESPRTAIDFGDGKGPVECAAIPWGDLVTAHASTGADDITTYFALTPALRRAIGMGPVMRAIMGSPPGKALARFLIDRGPAGPSEQTMATAHAYITAEARGAGGEVARARLVTPEPYRLTAITAIDAAMRTVAGEAGAGFRSPAMAFGADYILQFEGCERTDWSEGDNA